MALVRAALGGREMKVGTRVEVRSRFDGSWTGGFLLETEERDERGRIVGRRVRRASDGMVLPTVFDVGDVRREEDRKSTWWYKE